MWVMTAPIIVAINRHPEKSRKEKDEPVKTKGRMMPIPQNTSINAIPRTIRGLKYLTHNILRARVSIGWKKRMVPPTAKTKNKIIWTVVLRYCMKYVIKWRGTVECTCKRLQGRHTATRRMVAF